MGLRKLLLSLALLPAFVVISAMAIIATSLNKDAAMNKRLEARREKAAETREAREAMKIGNDLPKTLEGAYAAQDAIAEYWENCMELLVETGKYDEFSVFQVRESDVTENCVELTID